MMNNFVNKKVKKSSVRSPSTPSYGAKVLYINRRCPGYCRRVGFQNIILNNFGSHFILGMHLSKNMDKMMVYTRVSYQKV